ncbi:solute carrier organic anion transporter family member 1C1-like [Cyprinus carpio]|uniref:Solute carrier organic anion transporter family member n=1 Tax=Cyprinus carpio TaxID=7962 RepID=A0A9Q9WYT3_CYPCA|nr:solute carrier organic anion transporter family member 1C1-like [Cyprinus carpio]
MPRNCIRETSAKENEIFLWKMDPPNKERRSPENGPSSARTCCSSLKMFLVALSFAYFAKALSGSYMKSTITQLERRFDIPSYLIGVIDGSFEIGNLLVIGLRGSYFGAKLHRLKIIAIGCLLMSLGTFLNCLWPHFIIDDVFSPSEASQFNFCAKIYVDIGFVNMESISITPGDARWVGAWWLGYLIAGLITTALSRCRFWFLPKSLPLPERRLAKYSPERTSFIKDSPLLEHKYQADEPANFLEMAKDFLPTLRSLLGNPVYFLYLCITIIQFNSLIGMVTYKPKYIEQHYGQSASKANFLMGVINIPAVALGMFSGGVIMKKFKLSIMGAAKFALGTSLLGYFLSLFFFAMGCENASVAGITRSYTGMESLYKVDSSLLASCNADCQCPETNWDPVCGENGLTYFSPCLAGCRTSHGSGIDTVFEQCSCVAVGNHTASAGQCNYRDSCHRVFPYFLALSVITSFIISLGGTPGYMLLIRCIRPQLKSLALGFHTLTTRTLAGIPAPIYFGAIIDTTCLKWGQKKCGGRGACRIYNTTAYRIAYLGLTLGLRTASFFLCILGLVVLRRHVRRQEHNTLANGGTAAGELQALRKEENNSCNSDQCPQTADYDPERETRL